MEQGAAEGVLGTWPDSSKQLFEHLGYTVTTVEDSSKFDEELAKADVGILTFWNNKDDIWQGVHTVAVQLQENEILVYNRFDRDTGPRSYASIADMIKNKNLGPWILYTITKED